MTTIQPTKDTLIIFPRSSRIGMFNSTHYPSINEQHMTPEGAAQDVAVFSDFGELLFPLMAATAASVFAFNLGMMKGTEEMLIKFLEKYSSPSCKKWGTELKTGELTPTLERFHSWDRENGKALVMTDVIPHPSIHLETDDELLQLMLAVGMDPKDRQYRRMNQREAAELNILSGNNICRDFLKEDRFTDGVRILRTSQIIDETFAKVEILPTKGTSINGYNGKRDDPNHYVALRSVVVPM
jgi:hypothetical protein